MGGSGIYTQASIGFASSTVINSTIRNNSANGIEISNSNATAEAALLNSTISGNAGYAVLTGPSNTGSSRAILTNTTVADNGAGVATGGPTSSGTDETTLKNTILANNGVNCSGGTSGQHLITSLGHNISSDNGCPMFIETGDVQNIDPLLGALADNGGPTLTHGLFPNSPAIDAGDDAACPATDQRGAPRPRGAACDIGAYESGVFPSSVPSLSQWALVGLAVALAGLAYLRVRRRVA